MTPALVMACPATDTVLPFGERITKRWATPGGHPLLAKVVRTAKPWAPTELKTADCDRYTELSEFLRIVAFDFHTKRAALLFGEIHDNGAQHWFRAEVVRYLTDPPTGGVALVFEQFRADQQAGLDQFAQLPAATIADLKRATDWDKSGWPDLYDPLFQAAIDAKLPITAGDVPRPVIKKTAKEGPAAIVNEDRARLALETPLGAQLDAASAKEIEDAHCGMLPAKIIPNMAFAQRYRDASLAEATLKAAEKHGSAILIAGNGHVRSDRGVPWYIRQRTPGKKITSVMLIEVEDGKTDPEAYIPRDPDGKPAADFIIFTPGIQRGEPCEGMKAMGKPAAR